MFAINKETCITCMQCILDCPAIDIILKENKAHIKNENCIKCGHCIAICPTASPYTDDYDMKDIRTYNEETFWVPEENLMNFIKFRRSVRRFTKKEVSREAIIQIIEAGRFTQTSRNSQDVSFIVLQDKLQAVKDATYDLLKTKSDYLLAHPSPETEHLKNYAYLWARMYEGYKKEPTQFDKLFCNAPMAILVTAINEFDGAIAASNMELMTDALGLGTYFNGFFQFAAHDNAELLNMLEIPSSKKLVCCLVIGHPAIKYKRTVPRKAADITWL